MGTNLKGRATAEFDVFSTNRDGQLEITIMADSTSEEWNESSDTVHGTVALGRLVAEIGKVATPVTASERRFTEQVSLYVAAGLGEDEANALAEQVNTI
jgi:hypothetical protein